MGLGATATNGLAAVLGVMPAMAMLLTSLDTSGPRQGSGNAVRSLSDLSTLVESLQLQLLRGALELWKARCRAADASWWRSPGAASAVRARLAQCGDAWDRDSGRMAARAGKRRADAYAVRMVKKRAKREAKSLERGVSEASPRFLPPTMELLPGEPSPVSRPGDWLTWRAARFVAGGPGLISAAQGLAMARSECMH